jgi:hypothetical protein
MNRITHTHTNETSLEDSALRAAKNAANWYTVRGGFLATLGILVSLLATELARPELIDRVLAIGI